MPDWIILKTIIQVITMILSGYVFWKLMKYPIYFLGIALDNLEDRFNIQINDRLVVYIAILLLVLLILIMYIYGYASRTTIRTVA